MLSSRTIGSPSLNSIELWSVNESSSSQHHVFNFEDGFADLVYAGDCVDDRIFLQQSRYVHEYNVSSPEVGSPLKVGTINGTMFASARTQSGYLFASESELVFVEHGFDEPTSLSFSGQGLFDIAVDARSHNVFTVGAKHEGEFEQGNPVLVILSRINPLNHVVTGSIEVKVSNDVLLGIMTAIAIDADRVYMISKKVDLQNQVRVRTWSQDDLTLLSDDVAYVEGGGEKIASSVIRSDESLFYSTMRWIPIVGNSLVKNSILRVASIDAGGATYRDFPVPFRGSRVMKTHLLYSENSVYALSEYLVRDKSFNTSGIIAVDKLK